MNPFVFVVRRPVITLTLAVALIGGGVLASNKMLWDNLKTLNTSRVHAQLDEVGTRARQAKEWIVGKYEAYFHKKEEDSEAHHDEHKVVVTRPLAKDVILTQQYVCQIHSQRHIDICALESGYLKEIAVKEGQAVKKDDVMFKILPVLYKAKADAEVAKAQLAQLKFDYTKKLADDKVVSQNEVQLLKAELAEANAKANLAKAELDFADVKAPFDGIVDRQHEQLGSFIKEGDVLTTLSDNRVMWVYFNVPEARYLEYMTSSEQEKKDRRIELELANHEKFPRLASALTIEGQFNNETGNIAFRADFENPDNLLRHGQTGTILIHRTLKDAVVIPQRATFELLDKRYVWVIDENEVAHQRLITTKHELEDIFVVDKGIDVKDKIVLEGVRQIEEGRKVEYDYREPADYLKNQKFHAE